MATVLLVLFVLFITGFIALEIRSYRLLKRQTKMVLIQGLEIQKQMKELQHQNQLLEELNNEKQQIIGVVSHDLKGPFNRIFALTQLMSLSSDNLTEEQKDYLGKIHQVVADGLGMVRNLLDNRRLDDKGLELTPEVINLATTVSPLVKNYRVLADMKKIKIHFDAPSDFSIVADKMCLNRILDNLLSNALKFSQPGKSIFVSIRETDVIAEICIQDQGPGISAEDQRKLFQKYQRLTARPTGGESSTGLGLYLVKVTLNKMGGEILYESELGRGTTFIVRLKKTAA